MEKYKSMFKEATGNAFDQVDVTITNAVFEDLVDYIDSLTKFGKELQNNIGSNNYFWNKYLSEKNHDEIDEKLLNELTRRSEYPVELSDLQKYSALADNYEKWGSNYQIDEIVIKYDDIHVKFTAEFTGRWTELENDDFENPIFSDDQNEESIELEGIFYKTSSGWECEFN